MKPYLFVVAVALAVQAASGQSETPSADARPSAHAVFVMSNSVTGNQVLAFVRASDGSLIGRNQYLTGGRGSGGTTDPLGSQGSLTLSDDKSLLFAVNAGSGTLSVFHVKGAHLDLSQVISSGGSAPVAVAQHGDLVYVLNFAGNSNVVGFRLDEAGGLTAIPNSIRYLSTANSGPSSLAFSPDGRFLLVTEKVTNSVDVFTVQADGSLSQPTVNPNPIPGVFDVVFTPGGAAVVLQTGAPAGSTGSSISSYMVEDGGTLSPITNSLLTLASASCWVVLTPNGEFAFTSNAGSGSVSGFAVAGAGVLTAIGPTVLQTLPTGASNLDIAVSDDGKYAYTLDSGAGNIGIFAIQADGTLKQTGFAPGVTAQSGFNGLAAF